MDVAALAAFYRVVATGVAGQIHGGSGPQRRDLGDICLEESTAHGRLVLAAQPCTRALMVQLQCPG